MARRINTSEFPTVIAELIAEAERENGNRTINYRRVPRHLVQAVLRLAGPVGKARDEAEAAVRRVRELHARRPGADGTAYCDLCSNHGDTRWPCATVAALDSKEHV